MVEESPQEGVLSQTADALRNIAVDVLGTSKDPESGDEYSDEEERAFHAQYKEKNFM